MCTKKHLLFFQIVNLILIVIVLLNEKIEYDYYKHKSDSNELKQFNNFMDEKSKRVDLKRFQSWRNTDRRSTKLDIAIITKIRPGIDNRNQYFHLSMESVFRSIYSSKEKHVSITICDLNDDDRSYIDMWKDVDLTIVRRPKSLQNSNIINQETIHYLWCLKEVFALNSTAQHYLVFEDDVELDETRFFPVLNRFIYQLKDTRLFAVKLYHPPRLLGFLQPEPSRIIELLAISIVLYYLLLLIISRFNSCVFNKQSRMFRILLFVFCVNMTLVFTRQNVLSVRKYDRDLHLLVPAPFCCTPGMLYSRDLIKMIIDRVDFEVYVKLFRQQSEDYPIDKLLYEFFANNSIEYDYIEPNIITHFGRISTVRSAVDPRAL